MTELILPSDRYDVPKVLYIVDSNGREKVVPEDELWAYLPDASGATLGGQEQGEPLEPSDEEVRKQGGNDE